MTFVLLASATSAGAVDLLYVGLGDNTIATFDTSSGISSTIAASKATFANTPNIPMGLAFDTSFNLYAANSPASIMKFNSAGILAGTIGSSSNLNNPIGLAFDTSGNLYASNYSNNIISKFDASGQYVSNIGSSLNLNNPQGIAFDSSGNLFVANKGDNTISKFDASGLFISSINTYLNAPSDLEFDSSGNLYVVNEGGSNISKLNPSGGFIGSFGNFSTLTNPKGIAIDSSGRIFVSRYDDKISIFDPSGNYLTNWDTNSSGHAYYLAFKTVPEPSTYFFGIITMALIAVIARRRSVSIV